MRHLTQDGYTYTIEQASRFGPWKWRCTGIDLPAPDPAPEQPPWPERPFPLVREDGWLSWTYRGCQRKVERTINRERRQNEWQHQANAAAHKEAT